MHNRPSVTWPSPSATRHHRVVPDRGATGNAAANVHVQNSMHHVQSRSAQCATAYTRSVPAVPLRSLPVAAAMSTAACSHIVLVQLPFLLAVVAPSVDAAAGGVVPAQSTHPINAGALTAGPLLEI